MIDTDQYCRYCKAKTKHADAGYLGRGPRSVRVLRCDCGSLIDADGARKTGDIHGYGHGYVGGEGRSQTDTAPQTEPDDIDNDNIDKAETI